VIAANRDADMPTRPVHYRIGICAVADQIAAAEDIVVGAFSGRQRRLQGLPVAVYVANNEMAQV
jgi:hypothetical protein